LSQSQVLVCHKQPPTKRVVFESFFKNHGAKAEFLEYLLVGQIDFSVFVSQGRRVVGLACSNLLDVLYSLRVQLIKHLLVVQVPIVYHEVLDVQVQIAYHII
jgi:hypothetical protein